jgi:hypothetical protein
MTEAEWLACDDPNPMLEFLRYRAGGRKCRLFACACLRRAWHLLTEDDRELVAVVERYVDGLASVAEIDAIRFDETRKIRVASGLESFSHHPPSAAREPAERAARTLATAAGPPDAEAWERLARQERVSQAGILRDIFGSPVRKFEREHRWLTFQHRFVFKLALTIYRNGSFDDLPILGDALEEAGCKDEAILAHLRSPGPHARGCWALDLVLGRE